MSQTVGVSANGLIYADPNWYKPLTATGRIVKKENNDCNQDPNEIPLPEHIVFVEPGQYFGSTDASGRFAVDADSGNKYPQTDSHFIDSCPFGKSILSTCKWLNTSIL